MPVDHIRYDLLVREALRGVVHRIITDVARNGLPGDHHFYISFDTREPGVVISPRLREQYPQEMTIVLQHQFWDLAVDERGFEVGLSFGGVPEKLVVPFDALKGFFDPSVQFGLEFELAATTETEPAAPVEREEQNRPAGDEALPAPRKAEAAPAPAKPDGGAEVVRLDRFRKK
jgi:hypothetical protein